MTADIRKIKAATTKTLQWTYVSTPRICTTLVSFSIRIGMINRTMGGATRKVY